VVQDVDEFHQTQHPPSGRARQIAFQQHLEKFKKEDRGAVLIRRGKKKGSFLRRIFQLFLSRASRSLIFPSNPSCIAGNLPP